MIGRHGGLAAENRVGEAHGLMDGDGRQFQTAGNVADGIDVGDRAAGVGVHFDMPARRQLHTGIFEAEPFGVGKPPQRQHHLIGDEVAARKGDGAISLAVLPASPSKPVSSIRRMPFATIEACSASRQILIETAQDVGAAMDQRHLGAQTVENMRELDRDIAAAPDHDAIGKMPKLEGFVGGDAAISAPRRRSRARAARRWRSGSFRP